MCIRDSLQPVPDNNAATEDSHIVNNNTSQIVQRTVNPQSRTLNSFIRSVKHGTTKLTLPTQTEKLNLIEKQKQMRMRPTKQLSRETRYSAITISQARLHLCRTLPMVCSHF